MNKPLCQFLILCTALLWVAQQMSAQVAVPDAAPAETPVKKGVQDTASVRKARPVVRAQPVAASTTSADAAAAVPAPVESTRRVVYKPDDKTEVVYTLSATQPFDSKMTGQKIRLTITENGVRHPADQDKKGVEQPYTTTQTTSINTGRTKSVSQLRDLMRGAFQRFAAGSFTPGQDLGKVGDARYGGELHFIAESAGTMRFDYVPPTADTLRYRRVDIQKFAELLAQ